MNAKYFLSPLQIVSITPHLERKYAKQARIPHDSANFADPVLSEDWGTRVHLSIKKFLQNWPVGERRQRATLAAAASVFAITGLLFAATQQERDQNLTLNALTDDVSPVLRFPQTSDQLDNPGRLQAMNVAPVQDSGLALQWHLLSWPNNWFDRFPLSLDQNLKSARTVQTEEQAYWSIPSKLGGRVMDGASVCPQANPLTPAPARIWDSAILNAGQHVGQVWVSDSMADLAHPDLSGAIQLSVRHENLKTDVHGTHIAGLMGALRNGEGVVGVVPGLKIILHPLQLHLTRQGPRIHGQAVLDSLDEMFGALVAQSREGTSRNRVILLSWSFFESDGITQNFLSDLESRIKKILEHDVVLVVPAGNLEKGNRQSNLAVYPSAWAGRFRDSQGVLLPVSSLDFCSRPSWFSHLPQNEFGSILAAPGERIYSTFPGKDYGFLSGTSASAAQVAAILAFTSQQYPDVEMKTQVQTLLRTSLPIAAPSDRLVSFDAASLVQGLMSEYGWLAKH